MRESEREEREREQERGTTHGNIEIDERKRRGGNDRE